MHSPPKKISAAQCSNRLTAAGRSKSSLATISGRPGRSGSVLHSPYAHARPIDDSPPEARRRRWASAASGLKANSRGGSGATGEPIDFCTNMTCGGSRTRRKAVCDGIILHQIRRLPRHLPRRRRCREHGPGPRPSTLPEPRNAAQFQFAASLGQPRVQRDQRAKQEAGDDIEVREVYHNPLHVANRRKRNSSNRPARERMVFSGRKVNTVASSRRFTVNHSGLPHWVVSHASNRSSVETCAERSQKKDDWGVREPRHSRSTGQRFAAASGVSTIVPLIHRMGQTHDTHFRRATQRIAAILRKAQLARLLPRTRAIVCSDKYDYQTSSSVLPVMGTFVGNKDRQIAPCGIYPSAGDPHVLVTWVNKVDGYVWVL